MVRVGSPDVAAAPASAAPGGSRRGRLGGLRDRTLPQSILGMAGLLFFMALSAAFAGTVLFAYYRFELDKTNDRLEAVEGSVADDLEAAKQLLDKQTDEAIAQIDSELDELEKFAASGGTLAELLKGVTDSIYFVNTLDENGQPSVGTAFVLFSDSEQSFLITSYTTIRAATVQPGPEIKVLRGGEQVPAELNGWDQARDLALLVADTPNLPAIERADAGTVKTGDRIFAISGLGAAGGSIVQGTVADTSANALQHDAQVGAQFQGGPLLNSRGQLVGISSRTYAPFAFDPKAVFFGVPWKEACVKVVRCPDE